MSTGWYDFMDRPKYPQYTDEEATRMIEALRLYSLPNEEWTAKDALRAISLITGLPPGVAERFEGKEEELVPVVVISLITGALFAITHPDEAMGMVDSVLGFLMEDDSTGPTEQQIVARARQELRKYRQ